MPSAKLRTNWFLAVLLLSWVQVQIFAVYTPIRTHAGTTFFDRWDFYGFVDNLTWGNVTYVDRSNATSKQLAFVNSAGNAVIKVDNTTTLANGPLVNRDSVRITTTDSYGVGTLIVIDAVHMPYGCSVWPSFWSFGVDKVWPSGGEIDIIEGINGMDHNQIAIHTDPGCTQTPQTALTQSGTTVQPNCATDQGCLVQETKANSYGVGFSTAGGGVFALEYGKAGVNSWFWSRPDIPANLANSTSTSQVDVTTWGIPTAAYPISGCNFDQFFTAQKLVLLTTLCGFWAGVPAIYQSDCHTPTGSCFLDNVIGDGSNYANAYWEVKYIRTYLSDDVPPLPSTATGDGPTSTAMASQTAALPSASASGKSKNGAPGTGVGGSWSGAAVLLQLLWTVLGFVLV